MLTRLQKIMIIMAFGLSFLIVLLASQDPPKIEVQSTKLTKEAKGFIHKWESAENEMGLIMHIKLSPESETDLNLDDFYLEYIKNSGDKKRISCFGFSHSGKEDWLFLESASDQCEFRNSEPYLIFLIPEDVNEVTLCYRQPITKSSPIVIKRD